MKKYILWSIFLLIVGCGKKDGVHTEYFDDEKEYKYRERTYKDGIENGLFTQWWYKSEHKHMEGTYKDGKKDGLWTKWSDPDYNYSKIEKTYKDGIENGLQTSWYENGQKKSEATYKEGKQEGLWTSWYEDGKKKQEGTYKDGEKNGLQTSWYENGQKKSETFWKNGEWDGSVTEWDKNQQKSNRNLYERLNKQQKQQKQQLGIGKNECPCCGKKFSHSGYRLGYGKDAFGVNSQIGVKSGPYDSEVCAFTCEKVNGLLK